MEKMKKKAVLFDLDGTVLDTLSDLTASVNYALRSLHLPQASGQEVRRLLGNGAAHLMQGALAARGLGARPVSTGRRRGDAGTDELQTVALRLFKEHYVHHSYGKTHPYPGIMELLSALREKGLHRAIVSNKPAEAVEVLCRHFFGERPEGVGGAWRGGALIELSMGQREGIRRKPAPDMLWAAAEGFGLKAEDCLYVGDSEVDVHAARAAGMDFVIVEWGFRRRAELAPLGIPLWAKTPADIFSLLQNS